MENTRIPEAATRKTNTEMMVMVTSTVMTTVRVNRPENEWNRFFIKGRVDQQMQTYEKIRQIKIYLSEKKSTNSPIKSTFPAVKDA